MKVYIKTTETCNLQCKHCYIGDNRGKKGFFDAGKVIRWLKAYIKRFGIKEEDLYISFHGGEPFLADLDEMQKVCDAFLKASFDATSNLTMDIHRGIKDFILKNFQQKGIGPFVKTSWDYSIRFATEAQERLWEQNVKDLIADGVTVKVITCLTKPLLDNVKPDEYLSLLRHLGVKHAGFERLTANTTANKHLIPSIDRVDEWLLEVYRKNDFLEQGFFSDIAAACKNIFLGCRKRECMQNVLTINADGTIGGCPNSSIKDWFFDLDGNANPELRQKLIQKEQTRDARCYMCDLFPECNGDCHQLSWLDGKCYVPKKLFRAIKSDMGHGTGFISEAWL